MTKSDKEDTEVKKNGLEFIDNKTRGHIFKRQKPKCNKSFSHSQCVASTFGIGYQTM